MNTFLVPTDFSPYARKATLLALDLALRTNARLLVCHVYHKYKPLLSNLPASSEAARQQALDQMHSFLASIRAEQYAAVPIDFLLKEGDIVPRLSQVIDEYNVSLVIMGTQGAHNQLERIFGTNTTALAREGRCPVLAVPEQAALQPFQHLVYASSFEREEIWAMQQLVQIKNIFNSDLAILHVDSHDQLDLVDDREIKNHLRLRFPHEGLRFVTIEQEDVVNGIANYAETHPIDLLAFTMLEHDFWDRLLLDSVTVKLLQRLQIPMLALPEKGRELTLQQTQA